MATMKAATLEGVAHGWATVQERADLDAAVAKELTDSPRTRSDVAHALGFDLENERALEAVSKSLRRCVDAGRATRDGEWSRSRYTKAKKAGG